MPDYERIMLNYLELAVISQDRQQSQPTVRFLCLTGVAATRAGCLTVAESCRMLVLKMNPHHLLKGWSDFPSALRDPDFQPFEQQLNRFCHPERADFLLQPDTESTTDPVQRAEQLLQRFAE